MKTIFVRNFPPSFYCRCSAFIYFLVNCVHSWNYPLLKLINRNLFERKLHLIEIRMMTENAQNNSTLDQDAMTAENFDKSIQ